MGRYIYFDWNIVNSMHKKRGCDYKQVEEILRNLKTEYKCQFVYSTAHLSDLEKSDDEKLKKAEMKYLEALSNKTCLITGEDKTIEVWHKQDIEEVYKLVLWDKNLSPNLKGWSPIKGDYPIDKEKIKGSLYEEIIKNNNYRLNDGIKMDFEKLISLMQDNPQIYVKFREELDKNLKKRKTLKEKKEDMEFIEKGI